MLEIHLVLLQGGDCFDMCTVLCSLLLGAGFDAYVVTGYAPASVTVNDQTSAVCPLLVPEVVKPSRMTPIISTKHSQPKEVKYKIKSGIKPESTYQVGLLLMANACYALCKWSFCWTLLCFK